jgi:transposase
MSNAGSRYTIMYEMFQLKIQQCDVEIEKMLTDNIDNNPDKKQHFIEKNPYKKVNKNTPKNIDLNLFSYQYFEGVDLMAIEGLSYSTIMIIFTVCQNFNKTLHRQ